VILRGFETFIIIIIIIIIFFFWRRCRSSAGTTTAAYVSGTFIGVLEHFYGVFEGF
jgi:multidrug resistance efflux pump